MKYGTEGQRAAIGSARAGAVRAILNGGRSTWYVVNLETGETVAATGGLVAVDYDALDGDDRETFETGTDSDVAWLASRVGWSLDIIDSRPVWCPVGDLADSPHLFQQGTGVAVEWSVMGDSRTVVEACADCAEGVGS